jgi:hypothetical protein
VSLDVVLGALGLRLRVHRVTNVRLDLGLRMANVTLDLVLLLLVRHCSSFGIFAPASALSYLQTGERREIFHGGPRKRPGGETGPFS